MGPTTGCILWNYDLEQIFPSFSHLQCVFCHIKAKVINTMNSNFPVLLFSLFRSLPFLSRLLSVKFRPEMAFFELSFLHVLHRGSQHMVSRPDAPALPMQILGPCQVYGSRSWGGGGLGSPFHQLSGDSDACEVTETVLCNCCLTCFHIQWPLPLAGFLLQVPIALKSSDPFPG